MAVGWFGIHHFENSTEVFAQITPIRLCMRMNGVREQVRLKNTGIFGKEAEKEPGKKNV